ncbi:MAG TPA: DUF3786 domain-containing protein [Nitrospirota bacterium]|nr:DUF3786 domain-containing protein [Nitrospirota bacterium]
MATMRNPGEDKAWEILTSLQPAFVCRASGVVYDTGRDAYVVKSFGMDFIVSVKERTITSSAEGSAPLLERLSYFFRLSLLWYLVSVKDIACTGRLVKLEQIRGGDAFTRGSHVLPLDAIAGRYGKDKERFIQRGSLLGASRVENLGDVSIQLLPLPRVPIILSLWLEDEEFPARVDLLFDSTCDLHLPADITWSIAMMTALLML